MKIALLTLLVAGLLFASVSAFAQVAVIRGPYLQTATSNSIIIRWRTNTASAGRVNYGLTRSNLTLSQNDTAATTEHVVKLSNLRPHTQYFYNIGNGATVLDADTANHFYTLPSVGVTGTYRIGVFGDCGNNSINQRSVRDAFLKYNAGAPLDSWLLLGDNAYENGFDQQYQSGFFNIYRGSLLRSSPLWPSPGNHDYSNNAARQVSKDIDYNRIFSVPTQAEAGGFPSGTQEYYSFDLGNIHFVSLDSYGIDSSARLSDTTGPQARWLKKDLEANQNKDWVVVYFHHPPFTLGSHSSNTEPELIRIRRNLLPILERYGVDLVLCGHSHVYERSGFQSNYFGNQSEFSTKYFLTSSSGIYNGSANSCAFIKQPDNKGTVYVVSGSAGQLGGQQAGYPLPNMKYSSNTVGGSVLLEINGNRLDLKWIATDNTVRDQFTMMKNVNKHSSYSTTEGDTLRLTASFNAAYYWNLLASRSKTIAISPAAGDYTFIVKDNPGCVSDTFYVHVSPKRDSSIIELEAKYLNKRTVQVNWQYETAAEARLHHYVVERSANNINFVSLGNVAKSASASNGVTSNYTYIDSNNIVVRKLYYRIKTVDSSGVVRFSQSVVVNFNGLDLDDNIIIAPNPGRSGDFRIRFKGGVGQANINVYDMTGRRAFTTSILLNGFFKPLQLTTLPPGIYLVRIEVDEDFVIKRIMVLQ